MVELLSRRADLKARVSPADSFFIDFFREQFFWKHELKVLELWRQIREGEISAEDARELVPQVHLRLKRIKLEYESRRLARPTPDCREGFQ
jgi:hypothetical protein